MLQEGAAGLVSRLIPAATEDDRDEALRAAQAHLLSLGITGWQDAIVGRMNGHGDPIPAYLRAARDGTLLATVVGALWWDRHRGLEQLDELIERRSAATADRFRATSVKMMLDGVAENHTAAMLEPYLDGCGCATGVSGLDFIDPGELPRFVTALDRAGFQVHFHALGDRAVRNALDAVAAARQANGDSGHRHHLAHLQVVHPDDIPRFAEVSADRQYPAAVGRARAADGRADHPVPRRQAGWLAVPVPVPAGCRGGTVRRQRLAGEQPESAVGSHVAVNRIAPDGDGHRDLTRSCPESGSPDRDAGRLHLGQRPDQRRVGLGRINQGRLDASFAVTDADLATSPTLRSARHRSRRPGSGASWPSSVRRSRRRRAAAIRPENRQPPRNVPSSDR